MNRQDQNWQNFCANHLREWHGLWTRYSVQTGAIDSFRSLRKFQHEPGSTEIFQTNRHWYANGEIDEKNWQLSQQNSLPNGLFHPQIESMRGLFLAQGAAAWVTTQISAGDPSAIELFFYWEDIRHSVSTIYDKQEQLVRVVSIREDAKFPSQYWSTETELQAQRDFSGNWRGTAIALTANLEASPEHPAHFQGLPEQATFFFPDGISLSCPDRVPDEEGFSIVANWLVKADQLQQITVEYDETKTFANLKLELFQQ